MQGHFDLHMYIVHYIICKYSHQYANTKAVFFCGVIVANWRSIFTKWSVLQERNTPVYQLKPSFHETGSPVSNMTPDIQKVFVSWRDFEKNEQLLRKNIRASMLSVSE
jgi:hypothetical protein